MFLNTSSLTISLSFIYSFLLQCNTRRKQRLSRVVTFEKIVRMLRGPGTIPFLSLDLHFFYNQENVQQTYFCFWNAFHIRLLPAGPSLPLLLQLVFCSGRVPTAFEFSLGGSIPIHGLISLMPSHYRFSRHLGHSSALALLGFGCT